MFALLGRKAFWPSIPRVKESSKTKKGIWGKVSKLVTKRPLVLALALLVLLFVGAFNVLGINVLFNLMKSFPEEISSRQGFELLEEHYPAGHCIHLCLWSHLASIIILCLSHELRKKRRYFHGMKRLDEALC